MELRKFFGQTGKVYYVTYSKETHWDVFIENATGFTSQDEVVARQAAMDCGAVESPDWIGGSTHKLWRQLWTGEGK